MSIPGAVYKREKRVIQTRLLNCNHGITLQNRRIFERWLLIEGNAVCYFLLFLLFFEDFNDQVRIFNALLLEYIRNAGDYGAYEECI